MWVVTFNALTSQTVMTRHQLSNNGTVVSLTQPDVGSGDQLLPSKSERQLVYDVLHRYAYIAIGTTIAIVHLDTSNGQSFSHNSVEVAHTPISVKASTFNGETYLLVTYMTNNRGYVKRFRRYKSGWGNFGEPVLVTTPSWFDMSRVSNMILFKAKDSLSDYDTLWVTVAEQWRLYTTNLIDGTRGTFEVPLPCDNVERLVHSKHGQRMLIQCRETTAFFDTREKEFYAVWPKAIGTVYISESGKYGAVLSQPHSVTLLNLHYQGYPSISIRAEGEISNVTLVDVNSTQHYLCYTEQHNGTYTGNCMDLELAFLNATSEEYTSTLFDSSTAQSDSVYTPCPSLYTHRNLLVVQQVVCSQETCLPLLQLFDMSTLSNTHNVTGIDAAFLAFKAVPVTAPTTLTPVPMTEAPATQEFTTSEHAHTTPSPNTEHAHTVPSVTTPTSTELFTETTLTTHPANSELYLQCSRELEHSKESYQQLLWVTIATGTLFSLALLVTILLLMVLLCVAFRSGSKETETVTPEPYTTRDKPPSYADQRYTVT